MKQRTLLAISGILVFKVVGCSDGDLSQQSTVPSDYEPHEHARPATYEERFEHLAEQLEGEPPDVEIERIIHPDDRAEVHVECLTELGFDAEISDSGGISTTYPEDQFEARQEAMYICNVRFPVHPAFKLQYTEEVLEVHYEYYTGELLECLEREGVEVDTIPSFEVFVEDYQVHDWLWSPVMELQASSDGAVHTSCTEHPPDEDILDAYDDSQDPQ